ncbi:hypothetical protein HAX54_004079 [Datura stramonium]|uniref:Uncharacterized protein n=1 Tax=Datura stramonium TaxID=4076 RepID=A0ABS8WWI6_DATST|nr:hypothetical protein [Datura stramonium]
MMNFNSKVPTTSPECDSMLDIRQSPNYQCQSTPTGKVSANSLNDPSNSIPINLNLTIRVLENGEFIEHLLADVGKVLFLDRSFNKKTRRSSANAKVQRDVTMLRIQSIWIGFGEEDNPNGEGM